MGETRRFVGGLADGYAYELDEDCTSVQVNGSTPPGNSDVRTPSVRRPTCYLYATNRCYGARQLLLFCAGRLVQSAGAAEPLRSRARC